MSLVELLVVLAVLGIVTAIAIPVGMRVVQESRQKRLAGVAHALFQAVERYAADHGHPPWPGSSNADGLNPRTLEPLTSGGYLGDAKPLLEPLRDTRITAYDTPGLPGREGFWLLLVDRDRPEVQVLAASTDAFPLKPDTWLDGIYVIRGHEVERIGDAKAPPPQAQGGTSPDGSAGAEVPRG